MPKWNWQEHNAFVKTEKSPELDATVAIVKKYTQADAQDVWERRRCLLLLREMCEQYLSSKGFGAPAAAKFSILSAQVDREILVMDTAARGWKNLKKVFGPSGSDLGPTKTLQHHKEADFAERCEEADAAKKPRPKVAPKPTTVENYWLEGVDPKHRSWAHMEGAQEVYQEWLDPKRNKTDLSFFDYAESKGLGLGSCVEYLAPDSRYKHWVIFNDNLMYKWDEELAKKESKYYSVAELNTSKMETKFSGKGAAIWVCSAEGVFYTASHNDTFHHSSFVGGKRIVAAGEWIVSDGKLLLITHKTGHHTATPENLLVALKHLSERIDLKDKVDGPKAELIDFKTKRRTIVSCAEWLAVKDWKKCEVLGFYPGYTEVIQNAKARAKKGLGWAGPISGPDVGLSPNPLHLPEYEGDEL